MRHDIKLHELERVAPTLTHRLVDLPILWSKSRGRDPWYEAWVPRKPMTHYSSKGIVGTVLPNPGLTGREDQVSALLQPRKSEALVTPVLVRTI